MMTSIILQPRCYWLVFALIITSCSPLQRQQGAGTASSNAPIPEHWVCRGKIAIKPSSTLAKQGLKARVVNFAWQQAKDNTSLSLSGSFGLGRITIDASPLQATIRRGNEIISQAPSLSELVWENTGIELPTKNLRYWLIGQPQPMAPYTPSPASEDTAISGFQQQGWQIDYTRSRQLGPFLLPDRLLANSEDFTLRVAIQRWDLSPAS